MKVKAFIAEALGNCSVPVDMHPHVLKKRSLNFFNYCYNAHVPDGTGPDEIRAPGIPGSAHGLCDPSGPMIRRPLLPGDLGLHTSERVSEEDVQKAKDRIGVKAFPIWPPDLFAVTASLLERSGAYQRLRPLDVRYQLGGTFATKPEWIDHCLENVDWKGTLPIDPASDDLFGVCGVNRYILRLIGLMWAHGALTVLLPGDKTNESPPDEISIALKISIMEQAKRSNLAIDRFAKFFSNEVDEDLLREFRQLLDSEVCSAYLLDRLERKADIASREFVTDHGNEKETIYSRYLARVAINGIVREDMAAYGNLPARYPECRNNLLEKEQIPGLLKILWAVDYIQGQWDILTRATENLAPFNPNRLPEPGADPQILKEWEWCRAAIRLLIIADEASRAIGFSDRASGGAMSLGEESAAEGGVDEVRPGLSCKLIWEAFKGGYHQALITHNKELEEGVEPLLPLLPRTLTRCFDDELASVLPKARTSQVGCTIRSLSHNLALLPARGRVRARWARSPSGAIRSTLNILMVPLPYRLNTKDFRVSDASAKDDAPWGSFKVYPGWLYGYDDQLRPMVELPISGASRKGEGSDPHWKKPVSVCRKTGAVTQKFGSAAAYDTYIDACHQQLLEFVCALTESLPGEDVHAIVFPEASLTFDAFDFIARELPRTLPSLEILVAGLCTAPRNMMAAAVPAGPDSLQRPVDKRINGNFVATYLQDPKPVTQALQAHAGLTRAGGSDKEIAAALATAEKRMWPMRHIRSKHHRWSLDKRQLADYALSHRLRPDRVWWEDFDLLPREMLFCEFLSGSVMTALICEDLARIEPCQVALRAVGPNLVFVLLMDSAQVRGRWPHQYAGVLADDPGSSVLTLTSFGLIERSSKSRDYTSRSIGMWREPDGETREIALPKGCHAQLLTLRSEYTEERTLDSRSDNGDSAIVWKFAGLTPIKANFRAESERSAARSDGETGKNAGLPGSCGESELDTSDSKPQTSADRAGDENAGRGANKLAGTKSVPHASPASEVLPPKFEFPD